MRTKIMSLITVLAMLAAVCGSITALAAEPKVIGGDYTFALSASEAYAELDGTKYEASMPDKLNITLKIECTGIDYKYTRLQVGEQIIGILANGTNTFDVELIGCTNESEFTITMHTGTPTADNSAEKLVYGTYNVDDFNIQYITATTDVLGKSMTPTKLVKYLPIQNAKGSTTTEAAYATPIALGDGWNNSTSKGGTTPNVPIKLGFCLPLGDLGNSVTIDTAKFADGEHTLKTFDADGNEISSETVVIDNTAPIVEISTDGMLTYKATDLHKVTFEALLDGVKTNKTEISYSELCEGDHYLYLTATDEAGNSVTKTCLFTAKEAVEDAMATDYTATSVIEVNAYSNRLGEKDTTALRSESEVLIPVTGYTTEAVGDTTPYQSFVVNVGDSASAFIGYKGTTGNGSPILVEVYNHANGDWDTVGYAESGVETGFNITTEGRTQDGKLRVKVSPYNRYSGNTIGWISDTQYETSFADLNYLYIDDMNYFVKQYQNGTLAYVVHTGDLADDTVTSDAQGYAEFKVASDIQKILDDAGVPNGVVTGNHDVKHTVGEYKFFYSQFGAARYQDFDWYGGNIKNNSSHYDLITVGGYDFIFVYLGCYDFADEMTIGWVNEVLAKYAARNAVICTHEYISPDGTFVSENSNLIWDRMVVPNANVKMILCGHEPGACNQWREVEGTDRKVYEMLADYQFAELQNSVAHKINGYSCDGEGFVRMLKINEDGYMDVTTYSPTFDDVNYFPQYLDEFGVQLDLIPSSRSITTDSVTFGTYVTEGKNESADIHYGLSGDTLTYLRNTNKDTFEYETEPDTAEYVVPQTIRSTGYFGYEGLASTITYGKGGKDDEADYIDKIDLMPKSESELSFSSGNDDYTLKLDGGLTVEHARSGANWSTFVHRVNKKVNFDKYNRLYFAVSSETGYAYWSLYLNAGGREYVFTSSFYRALGYDHTNVESDIRGDLYGYIDLTDYITGEMTVNSVYFVVSSGGQEVTFDYYFLGTADDAQLTTVVDGVKHTYYGAKGEQFTPKGEPAKDGYSFTGWYTDAECSAKAQFPTTGTVYAGFEKTAKTEQKYSNTELDIVGSVTKAAPDLTLLCIILGAVLAAGIIAGVIILSRKKKA